MNVLSSIKEFKLTNDLVNYHAFNIVLYFDLTKEVSHLTKE